MKKYTWAALLTALMMLGSLSACGDSSVSTAETPELNMENVLVY